MGDRAKMIKEKAMAKVKLTSEYLKKIRVASDGVYDLEEVRARELVEAGNAIYLDGEVESDKETDVKKEVKKRKTKVMKPSRKTRTYKTK